MSEAGSQAPRTSAAPAWLLAAGCALVLFGIGSIPRVSAGPAVPGLDKLAHALMYAVLGGATARASRRSGHAVPVAHGLGLLAALLTGGLDELHQQWVPGRSAEVADIVADVIGGALGAAAYLWWTRAAAAD